MHSAQVYPPRRAKHAHGPISVAFEETHSDTLKERRSTGERRFAVNLMQNVSKLSSGLVKERQPLRRSEAMHIQIAIHSD
jgi:hypothetical protein